MGILGSAFGRALAGAGGAAASIANKYIDEELARTRAEALADLQRRTAQGIREDQAAFDDKRAPVLRQRAQDDATATAATQDTIEVGRLNNTILQSARKAAKDREAADTTRRTIDAKKTELGDTELQTLNRQVASDNASAAAAAKRRAETESAADTAWLKAQESIALADPKVRAQIEQARASAAASYASAGSSNANAQGQLLANAAVKRVQTLTDEMLKTLDDQTLTPEQRAKKLGELQAKLEVVAPKKPEKAGAGPTEEVVEELDDKGNVVSKKRTVKGPLGSVNGGGNAAGQAESAVIAEALKAGKGKDLVAVMEKQGLSPREIVAKIGEAEYAKIKGTDKTRKPDESGARDLQRAPDPAKDPIRMASERDLRRIAAIEGHTNQQAAKAELERRASEREPVDTSGIGFGGMP